MCTAERPTPRDAGFTFVEAIVVLAIVGFLAVGLGQTISSTEQTEQYLRAIRRVSERVQKVGYEIRTHLSASRRIYGRDAVGTAYLAALDLAAVPPLPGARLPRVDVLEALDRDAAGVMSTGNVVLFARESDAAPCMADPATKKIRAIDTYRFVCMYPSLSNRDLLHDGNRAVDLVIWRSKSYPSRSQILAITNATERSNVVKDLYTRFGCDLAWDPALEAANGFFGLSATGAMGTTPASSVSIAEDMTLSDRGRLVYGDVQLAATDPSSAVRKSLLTTDDPGTWTPHGFEAKLAGDAGKRRIWVHLTAETPGGAQRVAAAPLTLVVSVDDA